MSIFQNFLNNAKSIDNTPPITSLDRVIVMEIQDYIDRGDARSPGAAFDGVDEVQTLSSSGATAGTFDITVGVIVHNQSTQVAVAGLAYNAAPAAIQTTVDAALISVVPNYSNGDVAVTGAGTADANDTVFTYSGDSVKTTAQPISTVDGTGLTGGGTEAFAETTPGQSERNPWAIMESLTLVDFGGTPPTQGGSLPTLTKIIDRSRITISDSFLRAIAAEAAIADKIVGLEEALLESFGLQVENRGDQ